MNKAITDGLVLTPPPFQNGLEVWSSGDGTPGSDTYAGDANAAFVPADPDFGGCLELVKTQSTQRLRFMGETPLLPGCYLRISVRIKALSGNLPSVRIAGWPGGAGGAKVPGLVEAAPAVALTSYGDVVEVSAIVGTGLRPGVDMVWGAAALYGHFGLDLTGQNGGVVRIDDIQVEDITSAFLRVMLSTVDVRDFGAVGDGVADDAPAFLAADAAADGREVLVPAGVFRLGSDVTMTARTRFEGTVTADAATMLILQKNFDLPTYIDAFGNEELAFRKAFQALLNFSDHESLDMGGRRISVTAPIDMAAAVPNRDSFATRRVIRNGQFEAIAGPAWATQEITSQATYAPADPRRLSAVANVANVPVGALVEGAGVGREVYVTAKNVGAGTLTLSQPLFDAEGTQVFTFRRFRYVLDFSGFSELSKFTIADVEIQCNGEASGIMLAPDGINFTLRDSFLTRPRDRGITSVGEGCQGMNIDRCQFLSDEQSEIVANRRSIAFNANSNDVKIRDNRVVLFRHFCILAGTGNLITGNHWFQGDSGQTGLRMGGIVFTQPNVASFITGNYVDNNFIEWTNEHDATPDYFNQFSFGGLTLTGNVFFATFVADWFSFLVIKPHGVGHFINGLTMTGNVFRTVSGNIDRVERIDTAYADLDRTRFRNIVIEGNTYNGVNEPAYNPVTIVHDQNTNAATWTLDFAPYLPFRGRARSVQGMVPEGQVTSGSDAPVFDMPWSKLQQGPNGDRVELNWSTACRGKIIVTARVDNPV